MNKSTITLLVLAALGLGSLIGVSLVDKSNVQAPVAMQNRGDIESTGGAPIFRFIAPGDLPVEFDEFEKAKPSATGENYISRENLWKNETVVIELPVGKAIEHKAIMAQGDTMVFDWKTNGNQVYFDFHGHDEAFGEDFFVRYEENEGDQQKGMVVAPFKGEHGWYWLNMGQTPTTISLRVAGFFEKMIKVEVEEY
jgi:hypothetical protein